MRKFLDAFGRYGLPSVLLIVLTTIVYAAIGPTQSKMPVKFVDSGPVVASVHGGMPFWYAYFNPAAADTDIVHSLFEGSASQDTTHTFTAAENTAGAFSTHPRNVTLVLSGTQANVNLSTVVLTGKNWMGETITENYALTENMAAGTITGSKAFASLTSLLVPAQDGANVKLSVGIGTKLGLPVTSVVNPIVYTFLGSSPLSAATAGTVAVSATDIESNTNIFNTAPNGSNDYLLYIIACPFKVVTSDTR